MVAQRLGDVLHGQRRAIARLGLGRHLLLPRLLAAGAERGNQLGHHRIASRGHQHVHGGQRLIFHVGAGVQGLVEGGAHDLGGNLADVLGLAQRAAQVHPVKREDGVGLA